MIAWLEGSEPFPDVTRALPSDSDAPGLIAASATLSPERILQAYRLGIFPWYSRKPVLWWFTNPRMVLKTDQFIISKSFRKKLNQVRKNLQPQGPWNITFDKAFESVMKECAAPRANQTGTWIIKEMIQNYLKLHEMGYAHSVEVWHDEKLVGGLYGMSIGKMFYGESMFSRMNDTSKIALASLVYFLKKQGVTLIDCQQETSHLASLGASPISGDEFSAHLKKTVHLEPIDWTKTQIEI